MRRAGVLCLVLGVPSLAGADGSKQALASATGPFQVIDSQEAAVGGLRRITTTVQNGSSSNNRFVVERILPAGRNARSLRPIILAPGLGLNNNSYTAGDFQSSIAANLARGGNDVFLYSTRQYTLAPGSCDDAANCREAKDWGLQAKVDDFAFIRTQIAADHGPQKPIVGGASLGAATALAAINQDPGAYAGLIIIEYTAAVRPEWRPGYQAFCGNFRQLLAGGQLFDTQLWPMLQLLVFLNQFYGDVPADPSLGFPPGFTNRQVYLSVLGAPSQGPPYSVFFPGLVLLTTSVTPTESRFVYASDDLVTSVLGTGNNYTPIADFVDFTCSMSGETTFTSNLKSFTGPVLAFKAGHGVGDETQVGLSLLGSRKIQVISYPDLAHADLITMPDHATKLEKPILDWLAALSD